MVKNKVGGGLLIGRVFIFIRNRFLELVVEMVTRLLAVAVGSFGALAMSSSTKDGP